MDGQPTRIQRENSAKILDAALDVFSAEGFRGATVDAIARRAGLSKPNLLYYFPTKEAIHRQLLESLLDTWLDPLRALKDGPEPVEELLAYVRRKLEMSRELPRESRLFANEILQGAPRIGETLVESLKPLVDQKARLIQSWVDAGRLAPLDPQHLIFSIWSLTQHYADFDAQVQAVLGPERAARRFDDAGAHLTALFRALLTP